MLLVDVSSSSLWPIDRFAPTSGEFLATASFDGQVRRRQGQLTGTL